MSAADDDLLAAARAAADSAYAPYSRFHVGAAVRADDGRVFAAANVENASYGLSLCAEANAVAAAAIAGARRLTHVAVVGYAAAAPDAGTLAYPCGRCRQMLNEFAAAGMTALIATRDLARVERHAMTELLPHAFGPADLG